MRVWFASCVLSLTAGCLDQSPFIYPLLGYTFDREVGARDLYYADKKFYWRHSNNSGHISILRFSPGTQTLDTLSDVDGDMPTMRIHDDYIYYTLKDSCSVTNSCQGLTAGSLHRLPLTGGNDEVLDSGSGFCGFAIDGQQIFYETQEPDPTNSSQAISKAYVSNLDGTGRQEILQNAGFYCQVIAPPGGYLIFADQGGSLSRIPKAGGMMPESITPNIPSSNPLSDSSKYESVADMAIFGNVLYWIVPATTADGSDGSLHAYDFVSQQDWTVVSHAVRPKRVHTDGEHIYWIKAELRGSDNNSIVAGGAVMRVSIDSRDLGGDQADKLSEGGGPKGVTTNDRFVYWIDDNFGAIFRVDK